MTTLTNMTSTTTYILKLASCPNPDHGETSAPKARATFSGTADQIAKFAETYREGLGGGNWKRADIYLGKKLVARMSYNGRLWTSDGSPVQSLDSSTG